MNRLGKKEDCFLVIHRRLALKVLTCAWLFFAQQASDVCALSLLLLSCFQPYISCLFRFYWYFWALHLSWKCWRFTMLPFAARWLYYYEAGHWLRRVGPKSFSHETNDFIGWSKKHMEKTLFYCTVLSSAYMLWSVLLFGIDCFEYAARIQGTRRYAL